MDEAISATKPKRSTGNGLKDKAGKLVREKKPQWEKDVAGYLQEDSKPMSIGVLIILVSIAALLDLVDLLDFTGFGAIIVAVISFCLGAAFFFAFYIFDPETKLSSTRSLVVKAAAYTAELIPGIGILPINILIVVYAYLKSQPKFKKEVDKVFQATETGKRVMGAAQKLKKFV
ncbi:MAG: hypothetical protein A2418_02005 [Candidatus Brennerbacteria bacterium RIFOXYC1_FULL_41_11]|uniref:Uncharacterized protein n=1 Tax=Candidatus Brennerbacteria bacterium RIFOXYD1_FULL_41_16 TaxID=1797529 RepID=A0A1G1XM38_9BACT|nr:MAG: hypothetical protein UU61_C0010G0006 [Parcubacteria group bacterium GW2011_GWB1_41_4]OGY39620.1 MAG: hypothetical protein A2391_01360 [Candidatus Brennerbacteria bacterium RIFOXYB1_FULL_41_13]OGY39925.1 MAG: hypothetical protein A2418_02005 [Candidatus Brennerbacteria bacterium RIFOXYC1_FULL_41_11]OGY40736.1 MAG: hypothetical protein A2570_01220 [Candidatus Brennerbacteria bacterium RIFOXYD1_FULL_41_16]